MVTCINLLVLFFLLVCNEQLSFLFFILCFFFLLIDAKI